MILHKMKQILSYINVRTGILSAAIVILSICAFSCSSDKKAPEEKQESDTVAVDEMPGELKDFEKENYETLTLRFPMGWAYFVVDPKKKEIVNRGRTNLSDDFKIDWTNAKVHDIIPERLILQLPDISYKSEDNRTGAQMVNFPRGGGTSPRVKFSPKGLDMWVQVLEDNEKRIVVLLGFRENKQANE
jgi:hypothetical protein